MEFVLLLHVADYDETLGRFRSSCFENSSDGSGISIVDARCAERTTGSVCDHAIRYYSGVSWNPPIFWRFEESELPPDRELEYAPSDTGDVCHVNVKGISDNRAKKFFKRLPQDRFFICSPAGPRQLTTADITAQVAIFKSRLAGQP